MGFKYGQQNIEAAIATSILENSKNKKDKTNYRQIYFRVKKILDHPKSQYKLSHNKLLNPLRNMEGEKLLIKDDPTKGKRGSKVFYALTDKAKEKYRLKIIGSNESVENRKRLYCLLLFFAMYKRGPLLTEKQLERILTQIGSSLNDLEKTDNKLFGNFPAVIFKPVKGVEITAFYQRTDNKKLTIMLYYIEIPGFSIEEFMTYLRLLKKGKEPRPFITNHTLVPFIFYTQFTKKDVVESIYSLREGGYIKCMNSVFAGEQRYDIAKEDLRSLIFDIWSLRIYEYELLVRRILHGKPVDEDEAYLSLYVGDRVAGNLLAEAHDNIRTILEKKEKHNMANENEDIREIEQYRRLLIQRIKKNYENMDSGSEVLREITEGICYTLSPNLKF